MKHLKTELCSVVKSILSIVMFFGLSFTSLQAQAHFSPEQTIQIQKDTDLKYSIKLIKSSDSKATELSVTELRKVYNSPLSTVIQDPKSQEIFIEFELRARPDWKIEQWNQYLVQLKNKTLSNKIK